MARQPYSGSGGDSTVPSPRDFCFNRAGNSLNWKRTSSIPNAIMHCRKKANEKAPRLILLRNESSLSCAPNASRRTANALNVTPYRVISPFNINEASDAKKSCIRPPLGEFTPQINDSFEPIDDTNKTIFDWNWVIGQFYANPVLYTYPRINRK